MCNDCNPASAGTTAWPLLTPELRWDASQLLFLNPDSTKTGAKDGPMEAAMTCDTLCCISWLHQLAVAQEKAGHPITNYITRPQAASGDHLAKAWRAIS